MRLIAAALSLILLCAPVFAGESAFIYSKTVIKVVPKDASSSPSPASAPGMIDPASLMPSLKRVTKEFTVAIRPASFLQQRDFIALQPFSDKEGMMILIDPPQNSQLIGTRLITSADVLFVDADGAIVKIAPSLKLDKLTEPIDSGKPIHAFVYLKAGSVAADDIQLGDKLENTYFKTHPVILQ